MIIEFHRKFEKRLSKIDLKIRKKFNEKLRIFSQDCFNISLNNHQLHGKLKIYRSIDITGDWRALYKIKNDTIIFSIIDTHNNLYR